MKLIEAERLASSLGCDVRCVRKTGEMRFRHPLMKKSMLVNARRKDASVHLRVWMKRLKEELSRVA
jgi:hypothetical protein